MSDPIIRNFGELRALRGSEPTHRRFRIAKHFFHTQRIGRERSQGWRRPLTQLRTSPDELVLGWETPDLVDLLAYEVYSAPVNWIQVLALEQLILAAVMNGLYATARGHLKSLAEMVGASLWAENVEFFIHEHEHGWEAQKDLMIQRMRASGNRLDLHEIWYLISRKNERDSAADVFEADLNEIFTGSAAHEIRRFFRMWLRPWLPPQAEEIRAYAAAAAGLPIFDKFHALVYLGRGIANLGELKRSPVRDAFGFLLEATADARFRMVLAMTGEPELLHGLIDRAFIRFCDAYTTRQPVSAELREYLTEHSQATNAYELWMKAALREGVPISAGSPSNFLDHVTTALLRYGAHAEPIARRVGDLHNVIKLCPDATVSAALYGLLHSGVGASQGMSAPFATNLFAGPISPRELVLPAVAAGKLVEQVRLRYPDSVSLEVQSYIQAGEELSTSCQQALPSDRLHYYAACRAERMGRRADAFAEYRLVSKLLQASLASSALDKLSALRGAFRIVARSGKMKDALQVALSGFAANPEFVYSLEVKNYIERAQALKSWEEFRTDPKLAIAASLYGIDSFKVYLFVKGTLRKLKVKLPSRISPRQLAAATRLMLWEKTCTTDVLSRIVELETTDAIEQERMRLCQFAMQLGSQNTEALQREYSRLAYDQIVRTGLGWLDQSKLYVDVAAVLAKTSAELEDAYGNMLRYEVMAGRLKLGFRGDRSGRKEQEGIIVACQEFSLRAYTRLVEVLVDAFVQDNSHGLDAYLSLYMRHGSFRNHLTAVFERHGLLVDSADTPKQRRRGLNPLESAALKFSEEILSLLEDFRGNRLVATTDQNHPSAAFRIRLSEDEIQRSHSKHTSAGSELADIQRDLLERLWKQVNECADSVCQRTLPELQDTILQKLEEFRAAAQLARLSHDELTRILAAITQCTTDLQTELRETVLPWFTIAAGRPELKHDLMTLSAIAVAQVQARHPRTKFQIAQEGRAYGTIKHEYIYPFVEVLNILVENMYCHSGHVRSGTICGRIHLAQADGKLTIVVANPVAGDAHTAVEKMRLKLDDGAGAEADIRRTGGTGLRKARKLLRDDLDRRDVTFQPARDAPNQVRLEIKFHTRGFLV